MLIILLSALSTLLSNLETKTLQSDISFTVQEQGQAALTSPGKVTMQGVCFMGSARGYEVAYDGSTFYFYDPDANELTLTRPTEDELMMTNPLLYARYLSHNGTVRETTNKDGTITTVTITPDSPTHRFTDSPSNGLTRITVKIKDNKPLSVELKALKRTVSIRFKNPQYINSTIQQCASAQQQLPSGKRPFTISKDGSYINDLR